MKFRTTNLVLLLTVIFSGIFGLQAEAKSNMQKQSFGKTADGKEAELYVLTNKNGMQAAFTNFGAALVSLKVPDRAGKLDDVVLGYEDVAGYVTDRAFFGATIGRYGKRIAKGQFTLDGKTYTLPKNDGQNTLHGGPRGFNKQFWTAKPAADGHSIEFDYLSKDGEEGFPGNLKVQVTYTLTDKNELKIDYQATSDKDTVVNLTNHSYFNLAGQGEGDILGHDLLIRAARFTPVDAGLIPTGELRKVGGTPFDFTKPFAIGARINQDDEQLKLGRGYDHNFVLDAGMKPTPVPAATVYDPKTGRVMEVLTMEPGIQFYSGNFLDGSAKGKGGKVYNRRSGLCLETQHYPDSPNHPDFPTTTLKAGQKYHTTTVYAFSVRK